MDAGIIVYDYMDTFFCCMVEKDKWCEEMVSEHMLVYLCSGELELIAPEKKYHLKKGDAFFVKRNHLVRKVKQPSKDGEPFKGLFLQLKMPFLKRMLGEHRITVPLVSNPTTARSTYVMLEKHPFLNGLFTSLEQYFDARQYPSKELMEAKLQEAVFTLLQLKPDLGQVLFDFTEPWKINLEEFMNKNYKCDLTVEEFAHYTGRSLSTLQKRLRTDVPPHPEPLDSEAAAGRGQELDGQVGTQTCRCLSGSRVQEPVALLHRFQEGIRFSTIGHPDNCLVVKRLFNKV